MRIGARYEGWNWCYQCKRTVVDAADPDLIAFGDPVACEGCKRRYEVIESDNPSGSGYALA